VHKIQLITDSEVAPRCYQIRFPVTKSSYDYGLKYIMSVNSYITWPCVITLRDKPATNYSSWIEFEKQPVEVRDVEAAIDLSIETSRESSASR
jgi:hypothetical protein